MSEAPIHLSAGPCLALHCREYGVMVLRPLLFQQRNVHFVVLLAEDATQLKAVLDVEVHMTCLRVPVNLRSQRWPQLLEPKLRSE